MTSLTGCEMTSLTYVISWGGGGIVISGNRIQEDLNP